MENNNDNHESHDNRNRSNNPDHYEFPLEDEREPYSQQRRKQAQMGGDEANDRYTSGFDDGFTRSRQIFWRDCMRRSKEAQLMASHLRDSPNGDLEMANKLEVMAATYINVCELLEKAHSLYPGAKMDIPNHYDDPGTATLYYY